MRISEPDTPPCSRMGNFQGIIRIFMLANKTKFILGIVVILGNIFFLKDKIFAAGENCARAGGSCEVMVTESGSTCGDGYNYIGPMDCPFGQGCCVPEGSSSSTPTPTPTPTPTDTSNSLVPCTNGCNLCDIIIGLNRIFKYLGTLLVIVATLFIIIAGIAYMVSGGSKNLMEWAKKALMYALIGFVLYLASWMIVSSILSAMGYNRSGWSTFDCEGGGS